MKLPFSWSFRETETYFYNTPDPGNSLVGQSLGLTTTLTVIQTPQDYYFPMVFPFIVEEYYI